MMDRSKREWVPLIAFGQIEQQLGNYETALDWYERSAAAAVDDERHGVDADQCMSAVELSFLV